jgi:hypothetical protein
MMLGVWLGLPWLLLVFCWSFFFGGGTDVGAFLVVCFGVGGVPLVPMFFSLLLVIRSTTIVLLV